MTRERYESLPLATLKELAKARNMKGVSTLKKSALIDEMLKLDETEKQMQAKNSAGGIIECVVKGVPAGVGEPVFGKLDAALAQAVMSIGAVKGVEIGDGFQAAAATGKTNNDAFCVNENGAIGKETNHAGGILGGMSDGSDIVLRAAFKPTPSVFSEQKTVTTEGEPVSVEIKGRHDPIIVPRAVVVVEAMTAMTILDKMFVGMTSRLDRIVEFYRR